MSLKDWFEERKQKNVTKDGRVAPQQAKTIEDNLWTKCPSCKDTQYTKDLVNNYWACTKCATYLRVSATDRIGMIFDDDTFHEVDSELESIDRLKFVDSKPYTKRLEEAKAQTGMKDGVITGHGLVNNYRLNIAVMDFNFMGGSMGSLVGHKIARIIEIATENKEPVMIVSASGGARMQEGVVSLMQMAKTSAALSKHKEAGQLFISFLTDPTAGGVTASFAMLGDYNISEPNASIAFTGRRVIEQTIKQKLPKDFQTAEYLKVHGMIDAIIERKNLKTQLTKMLSLYYKPVE